MGTADRLDEILDAWQSAHVRGEDLPLAELCHDCPELLPEAERRVAVLRRVEGLKRPSPPAGRNPTADSTRDPVGRSAASPDSTTPYEGAAGAAADGEVAAPGYEVGGEIARGNMGRVLAGRDLTLGREVAIKVVLDKGADPATRARTAARFVRESRITGRLAHPNIPPVYRLGRLADGAPFLAMKFVRGRTLAALLADRPGVAHDLPRFVTIVEQVCQAVGYAHAQGVVHRDLKPANVMVGAFGEVQVMDWGLAKVLAGPMREPPAAGPAAVPRGGASGSTVGDDRTQAGVVVGTPAYMAPEQARGEEADARADVFALGGLLAAVLVGRPPFASGSVASTLALASAGDTAAVTAALEACEADPELVGVALRCLAPAAADRPADGTAVAGLLAAYRAGVEGRLRAAERDRAAAEARAEEEANTRRVDASRAAERRRRQRAQWLLGGATALLVVSACGVVGLAALWQRSETALGTAETAQKNEAKARAGAEAARLKEAAARQDAEKARAAEKAARTSAESARDGLARAEDTLARVEYGGATKLALQAWRDSDLATARLLLAGTRPEFRRWEWQYLTRLCDNHAISFPPPLGSRYHAVAFSRDGGRVLTASTVGATVWDARTGERMAATAGGHPGRINGAALSPDGARVVTAGEGGTAHVWDARTGAVERTLTLPTTAVYGPLRYTPDGERVVFHCADGMARVVGVRTWTEVGTIREREKAVTKAVLFPDARRAVTVTGGGCAVTDISTGAVVAQLAGHPAELRSVVFSPDGRRLATSTGDGTTRVWEADTGKATAAVPSNGRRVVFSPDGRRLATSSEDGTTRVWEADTGKAVAAVKKDGLSLGPAAFTPDGKRLITGEGITLRLWDAETWAELVEFKGHSGAIFTPSFSPDGTRLLTVSNDTSARVWDIETGKELDRLMEYGYSPVSGHQAVFSPDGKRVLATTADGGARVWDLATTRAGFDLPLGDRVSLSGPDGRWAIETDDNELRVTDPRTGAVRFVLKPPTPLGFRTVSPDGGRVAAVSATGRQDQVSLFDSATGEVVATLNGHDWGVVSAEFSPDGTRVVTAAGDWTARIWDARTGAELAVLRGHIKNLRGARFSPDGTRVVTISMDGTARVWEAATGREVVALPVSPVAFLREAGFFNLGPLAGGMVNSASFSPDGKRVVTTGSDSPTCIWDATTGALLVTIYSPHSCYEASFSPDGERVVGIVTYWSRPSLWDARSGSHLLTLDNQGHPMGVSWIGFSSDGAEVIAVSSSRLHVWDARPANQARPAGTASSARRDNPGGPADLLADGSFEADPPAGWVNRSWRPNPTAVRQTAEPVLAGRRSVALHAPPAAPNDVAYVRGVEVRPHTRYRLTGWVKTSNVVPAEGGAVGATLCVFGGFDRSRSLTGTVEWTRLAVEFDSGPRTRVEVGPRLGHHGSTASGTAWFDDLRLMELTAPLPVAPPPRPVPRPAQAG